MSEQGVFSKLSPHEKALVAIAVLFDGKESAAYLRKDISRGTLLSEAALSLGGHPPELRMPFAGTLLRQALEQMASSI